MKVKGQIAAQEFFLMWRLILKRSADLKKNTSSLKKNSIPFYKYALNNLASIKLRMRMGTLHLIVYNELYKIMAAHLGCQQIVSIRLITTWF